MSAPVAINRRICTAALWSACRCLKCNPDPSCAPALSAHDEAAACTNDPAGGGTLTPANVALANAPLVPAAAPTLNPSPTGGGLFGDME